MLSSVFYSRDKSMGDKGATPRGRVKSWYARNVIICEPSIVRKHSHDKAKPSCLRTLTETITYNHHLLRGFMMQRLWFGQQLS